LCAQPLNRYDANGVEPLFPFGHGLSYTTFTYGDAAVTGPTAAEPGYTVSVRLTNSGAVSGSEVAQLYLAFPEAAGEPLKQLKGIAALSPLKPGASATVAFTLPRRAFSIWDPEAHAWAAVKGRFTASVGASSRDLRVAATIDVAW